MLRIVQWNTGIVGTAAVRGIAEHPGLELVGCFAHSKQKVGRDVGELCGIAPLGVTATDDVEKLLALAPDCILYNFKESFGEYAVRYWLVDFARDDPTSSEVRTRVYVALQRAGATLSIPAQSVFMTLESRSRSERKRQEERVRRTAVLKRVKEIGVRKVMGADRRNIVTLLLWQFSKPILVANIVAWPLGFWAMTQ